MTATMKLKVSFPLEEKALTYLHLHKQMSLLFNMQRFIESKYCFSSSHIWMYRNHKGGWVNWCFQTVMLKKTLESPLHSKEIKLVNPKGNQSWIFIGRTDAEAEAPILWSPDVKSQLTGKKLRCRERLRAGGEKGNRGWMASPIQWNIEWVGTNFGR